MVRSSAVEMIVNTGSRGLDLLLVDVARRLDRSRRPPGSRPSCRRWSRIHVDAGGRRSHFRNCSAIWARSSRRMWRAARMCPSRISRFDQHAARCCLPTGRGCRAASTADARTGRNGRVSVDATPWAGGLPADAGGERRERWRPWRWRKAPLGARIAQQQPPDPGRGWPTSPFTTKPPVARTPAVRRGTAARSPGRVHELRQQGQNEQDHLWFREVHDSPSRKALPRGAGRRASPATSGARSVSTPATAGRPAPSRRIAPKEARENDVTSAHSPEPCQRHHERRPPRDARRSEPAPHAAPRCAPLWGEAEHHVGGPATRFSAPGAAGRKARSIDRVDHGRLLSFALKRQRSPQGMRLVLRTAEQVGRGGTSGSRGDPATSVPTVRRSRCDAARARSSPRRRNCPSGSAGRDRPSSICRRYDGRPASTARPGSGLRFCGGRQGSMFW